MVGLRMLRVVGNADLVKEEEAAAKAALQDRQNEPYIYKVTK